MVWRAYTDIRFRYIRIIFCREPGSNELDCGKMTAKEAEDAYRKETETYQLTLTFRGDESETIAGKDFDYTIRMMGKLKAF